MVVSRLLQHLDSYTQRRRVSTAVVACHDRLFLQYDAPRTLASKDTKALSHVLDVVTLLMGRLRQISSEYCAGSLRSLGEVASSIGLRCESGLANLEHMLRCLQQAAFDALIQHGLKRLEGELTAWYHYWKQRRHTSVSWFTEWPSGRRPLSTTWPWNIRPSLVVLWGVCWMFYADHKPSGSQAERFPYSLTTRQPPQPSLPPNPRKWRGNLQETMDIADEDRFDRRLGWQCVLYQCANRCFAAGATGGKESFSLRTPR